MSETHQDQKDAPMAHKFPEKRIMMHTESKILITGITGMVGSAIARQLLKAGYSNILGTYHRRDPDPALWRPDSGPHSEPAPSSPLTTHDSPVACRHLDLKDQSSVHEFLAAHKPDYVFLAAAKVGGIQANNTYPAEFIHDNLIIQDNVIHAAHQHGVERLLFLGSSCIYPKHAPQPMKEEHLLTGPLEPTNEPYAIAKIAGIKTCEAYNRQYGTRFVAVMPTNLYGPSDNFDLETSHVLPALIRKFHLGKCLEQGDWESLRADLNARPIKGIDGTASSEAILKALSEQGISILNNDSQGNSEQQSYSLLSSSSLSSDLCPLTSVHLWGTGTPRREFLHVDDMAEACLYIMKLDETAFDGQFAKYPRPCFVNIGTGQDCTIKELAGLVKEVIGFQGQIRFDPDKPDGTPQKLLDVTELERLGWEAKTSLSEGIVSTYNWYTDRDSGSR